METSTSPVTGRPFPRGEKLLLAALFLTILLATLLTANDYGPTYDEPHYASAGVHYADWWARVFRGDIAAFRRVEIEQSWALNHEHPPLQKAASGFSQRWFGRMLPGLMSLRLPSALWFALVVSAVYLFCRIIWGRRGALFGALALATMPRVFAHAHFVALDMPIMAWFFIAAVTGACALRRRSWPWAIIAGVVFGIALAAKLNAFFLPVLLLTWGLLYYRSQWPKLAVICLLGPVVFFICWPWLWIDTIAHTSAYLAFHLGHAAYNVWYLGKLWPVAPWHYPFIITAVTTPVLLLLAAGGGLARATRQWRKRPEAVLLLLGLAVMLLPNALPSSPKYNGERLFLPTFPFLAALAGGGFAWLQCLLTSRFTSNSPEQRRLAVLAPVALGALLLLPGANALIRDHPYQLAYYNGFIGGTRGATAKGFETIYWGQVFEEAPLFLSRITFGHPRVLVIPKGVIYLLEFQRDAGTLRADIQFTGDEAEAAHADFVMFQAMQSDYTELCWWLVRNAEPIWTVNVEDGTPLLYVYDRPAVRAALAALDRKTEVIHPTSNAHASNDTNNPTRKLAGS